MLAGFPVAFEMGTTCVAETAPPPDNGRRKFSVPMLGGALIIKGRDTETIDPPFTKVTDTI
jgi:hypothetical protein